jgi:drug/metabolite transporter (DMT)-like permease
MAQQDNQRQLGFKDTRSAEQILQSVSSELQNLHEGLIAQLSDEVNWLRTEKTRLQTEVESLRAEFNQLQSQRFESLSQHQVAQQQVWAKQLAQVLANHLQTLMLQRLNQVVDSGQLNLPTNVAASGSSESAKKLLASFDSSFSNTFKTLQRELGSYESSLSQQLNRMHSMEQQGEAILEALIVRLREELQGELVTQRSPAMEAVASNGQPASGSRSYPMPVNMTSTNSVPTVRSYSQAPPLSQNNLPLQFPDAPVPPHQPKPAMSQFRLGLGLVLLSTLALSFHNVVVKIVGFPSTIFGLFELGGFIKLNLGNSLLILWLRMLIVLPLMIPVAMFLYPPVWRDIQKFAASHDRRPLWNVLLSGVSLFLSQILIYIAIGKIGPGAAVTLLFIYPIVTVPLAWLLFRDRPTPLRWLVVAIIFIGIFLTALPKIIWETVASGGAEGVLIAVSAGVAFAFYLLFMQLGFKKLNPVPVSLIQFSTIFLLSSLTLLFNQSEPGQFGFYSLGVQVNQSAGFIIGGFVLGVLTLIGYLANNFGVRLMGASLASIVASSGPAVTALLGLIVINDQLKPVQFLGILLVTSGVGLLSWERMRQQANTPKLAK